MWYNMTIFLYLRRCLILNLKQSPRKNGRVYLSIEKAYRDKVDTIMAYKLTPEQFIPFLTTKEGYKSFIEYWNGKLKRGRF